MMKFRIDEESRFIALCELIISLCESIYLFRHVHTLYKAKNILN